MTFKLRISSVALLSAALIFGVEACRRRPEALAEGSQKSTDGAHSTLNRCVNSLPLDCTKGPSKCPAWETDPRRICETFTDLCCLHLKVRV